MFQTFLSVLKRAQKDNDDSIDSRRRHMRRSCDRCVSMIGDKMYPVKDWSPGGIRIAGDGRMFSDNQSFDIVLKFRLRGEILNVQHTARVVRKTRENIALEFSPLTTNIRRSFQQVVDDYLARRFAESQMV